MLRVALEPGEVHVWPVRLCASAAEVSRAGESLSSDERERALRFRFDRHREAFMLARAVLRKLLGNYLDIPAAALKFGYGGGGKPFLGDSLLRFNLSHSGELALYAFAIGCEVGIDVEEMRAVPDLEGIAARFFSRGECEELAAVEVGDRAEAFLNCWTRKEAYIKATGDGLSLALDSFQVTLRPGEAARFVCPEGWMLHHLAPVSGYVGALAFAGERRDVRVWSCVSAGDAST